jgi:hypothetical protein
LYLVKHGVPFDIAFSLAAEDRFAWVVIFAGFEGRVYDWDQGNWQE